MWEGLSLPHDTKFGNCRGKIVDSRAFPSWSLIHGLSWSGLINAEPVGMPIKVADDDIAFKLAILKKPLHLNDNTCFCSIIQSSKLVLGSLLAKNNFFVQFWTKKFASSRMANCGSGLPAEWPFRSQNASDSPLPGGLWVKCLITHALCSLAYSEIAWCKLFLIFTMKCLYWVFFAYKTPYSVLIDNSIHIQEIDTEKTWLTLQGQIFRCIKHLSVWQLKYLYIVSVKYFQ